MRSFSPLLYSLPGQGSKLPTLPPLMTGGVLHGTSGVTDILTLTKLDLSQVW